MKRLITGARAALSSRVSRSTLHTFTCTLLLAAAACRAFGGGVYSETTFYRDVSEGVWAAPSGFQISHYTNTAAGTYTNGATTIYYRLSASVSTNERTPISSVLTAAWYGTNTASNVVVLAWDKSDAAVSYVVERSYDNATWTNWYAVAGGFSAPTNASDVGGLATGWTNTDWAATTAEVAAPTFPWGGGGSAGLSSVLAIDNNANTLAITNVSDIVTTGDATFGENDAGSDISIRAENNTYGGSIRVFGETAGGHITMRTDDNNGTVQIEIRDGTVYDFDEGFLNMGSASITNLSNIYSGAAGTTNAVTSSGIVDIGPTLALALLASTALQNVAEDTTPQLGGNLDANGGAITNLGTGIGGQGLGWQGGSLYTFPTNYELRNNNGVRWVQANEVGTFFYGTNTMHIVDFSNMPILEDGNGIPQSQGTATTGDEIVNYQTATNLIALLAPAGTTNLAGLQDVADLSGVADTEALVYDAPSGLWTNGAVASAGLSWVTNSLGSTNTVSVDVGANTYHLNLDPSGIIGAGSALDDLSDVDASAPSVGDFLQYTAAGWTNYVNTSFAKVYVGSNQTITDAAVTALNFTGETYDIGGNFNTSTDLYTAPEIGTYLVTISLQVIESGFDNVYFELKRSGSIQVNQMSGDNDNSYNGVGASALVRITSVGQTIAVGVYHNSSGNRTVFGSTVSSVAQFVKIN